MPDWKQVTDAYAHLLRARTVFDDAMLEVIQLKNPTARPVLEVLSAEVEHLTQALLDAFGPSPAVDPEGAV